MIKFTRFPNDGDLDADNSVGELYSITHQVAPADSIASAVVEIVDPTSTTVDPAPTVLLTEQVRALVSANLYGLSFRATGTGVKGDVYIRYRYVKGSGYGSDRTFVLGVTQR